MQRIAAELGRTVRLAIRGGWGPTGRLLSVMVVGTICWLFLLQSTY